METNARAVSRGPGGALWIGTVEGLVVYNPLNDYKDLTAPDLILFPPEVEGQPVEGYETPDFVAGGEPDVLQLPYTKNSLKFHYTGIHTTSPNQNRFMYMLEGFESEWSLPVSNRSVSYERLPVGSYTFRLKALNLDGISSKQEARFSFSIEPPFWKTSWFIILEVLTGLLLVIGIIKMRERQLIREKRVLEAKVKERTREIEDQKLEIETQRDHIVSQNEEITASIHYARRIQQAVLPGKHILERSLPEHFIFFRPRDIVSGDFYWVEEKDNLIIVCAADCTGHGVPGAFMSLLGLTFLNEIVNKDGIVQANEILNRLRTYIITALSNQDGSGEAKDGMDLALVVIDRDRKQLDFAGAYNPLILIRHDELVEYKADKMPIGKHVGPEKDFLNQRIPLHNGDMIFLFSDGFQDQFGGEMGKKYKTKPFKRLLQKISSEPAGVQADLLERELEAWKGNVEQVDDILIMGIRIAA
jgi:serine phosphatase RsbU (regulator of sigma subunit)